MGMSSVSIEIVCPSCHADTLLRREPQYEDFRKVGERLSCASCGHLFSSETDLPFKQKKQLSVFTADEKPQKIEVFRGDEKGRNCRHCRHFVVNPFIQRCGRHHREVQATDLCADFNAKPAEARRELPGSIGSTQGAG
jgi:hypothetical protein